MKSNLDFMANIECHCLKKKHKEEKTFEFFIKLCSKID